jgi:hypothetical protein
LEIKDELGKGSFGVVSKGILKEWEPMGKKSITVAIKVDLCLNDFILIVLANEGML